MPLLLLLLAFTLGLQLKCCALLRCCWLELHDSSSVGVSSLQRQDFRANRPHRLQMVAKRVQIRLFWKGVKPLTFCVRDSSSEGRPASHGLQLYASLLRRDVYKQALSEPVMQLLLHDGYDWLFAYFWLPPILKSGKAVVTRHLNCKYPTKGPAPESKHLRAQPRIRLVLPQALAHFAFVKHA